MSSKDKYQDVLGKVGSICVDHELGAELSQAISTTAGEVAEFRVKVPLMGGFNAGKSSLLNAFIGRDELLPTAIKAETAIAAELEYGDEEKIIAHDRSGGVEQFPLVEISNVTHQKYDYIEIQVNAEALRQHSNIVFVDMPGLDSDIKAHNQAIMSYLNDGSYFLLLADIEQQVRGTIMDFVRNEIIPLGFEFAVILTKSDQKDPAELETIRTTTAEQLLFQTGRTCQVALVSAHAGEIGEFVNLVNAIDIDRPVQVRFQARILGIINEAQRALMIKRSCIAADTREIEDKIRELQKNKQALSNKIAEESRNLDRQFSESIIDAILLDVGKALQERIDSLVAAAKAGEDAFGKALAGIVRPALMQSSQTRINAVFEASLESIRELEIRLTQQNLNIDLSTFDKLKQVGDILGKMKNPWIKAILTGLAVLTNVVGPWVELIIIFAPDFLGSLVNLLTNQDEKIKNKILMEMIPQIQDKLRGEIKSSLQTVKNEFLSAIEAKISSETQVIEETLRNIEVERTRKIEDEKSALAKIDRGISLVQELVTAAHGA